MFGQQVGFKVGQKYGLILSDLPEYRTMLRHRSSFSLAVSPANANERH